MFESAAIISLWILTYCYLILASVDFGASFYLFYEQMIQGKSGLALLINDYLSPVSEITNVCFVFFFAAVLGFFPEMSYYYGTSLIVPGIIAVLLIVVKGTFFTIGQLLSKDNVFLKWCNAVSGISGLVIPAALSVTLVVSEGGYIRLSAHSVRLMGEKLWGNFYFWSVMAIAVVSILYISAMFLTFLAHYFGHEAASDNMRNMALFWSMPTVLASGLVFLGLQNQNPVHFNHVLDLSWMFLLSLLCFFIAVAFIFLRRYYKWSFLFVMLQYFFAFFGYGISHFPYILYPYIKVNADLTIISSRTILFLAVMAVSILIPIALIGAKMHLLRRRNEFKRAFK